MDDIVKQALAKWPNVPNCYGWLGLDARGNWYMRDDRAQAAGPFSGENPGAMAVAFSSPPAGSPRATDGRLKAADSAKGGPRQSKGSLLKHEKLIDFIQRNYESDDSGQWFFQNGPQRVYVELELTPWVWRISLDSNGGFSVAGHDGRPASVKLCVLDELGRVYLDTDAGFGLIHTQDVDLAARAVEAGLWHPLDMRSGELPSRFGYVLSPEIHHKTLLK